MLNLSLKKLKVIAKMRGVKGCKSQSEGELLSALTSSKPVKKGEKPKENFSKARIENIGKEFNESRHKFCKSKINEIRKNLYETENKKNRFASKIKEIERNLTELEENLSKTKKYYSDIEYKGVRDVKYLFDLSIDEDYYKPIITKSAFNNNYIQYESKGHKEKNLSVKKYLNIIKPCLNDHKTHGLEGYHSGDKTWVEKTLSEWKIQLTMAINFISSKDSDETRTMHTKSNNEEIMMGTEIIEELSEYLLQLY